MFHQQLIQHSIFLMFCYQKIKEKIRLLKKLNKVSKMRQNKDKIKKLTSDVIQNMIRSNYLQTDDMKTVIYNSDMTI